ncbi:MAG: response regulator [Desulfobulbaceae bacterium]|nr:response regulator [Desulfobulbaceae bacterium]
MKILVVEDNEDSRNLLMKQLCAYGHEVTATANGVEALEQSLAQPPDIIISDIMMPKMDGFQLCQECKQNEQLKNIPFIFYTATYISDEDEKFALSLGADAFIPKATEPDIFIQKLCEVFEKAKSHPLAPDEVTTLEPSLYLTEYNKRIVAKLEEKVAELEVEITERKKAEEKLLNSMQGTIQAIALTVETRDPYTAGHQRRVTTLATSVATKMARSEELIQGISMAGIVHDIGKMLLMKAFVDIEPNETFENMDLIIAIHEIHTTFGAAVLKKMRFSEEFIRIAEFHHWNDFSKDDEKELLIIHLSDHLAKVIGFGFFDFEDSEDKEKSDSKESLKNLESLKQLNLDPDKAMEIADEIKAIIRDSAQTF